MAWGVGGVEQGVRAAWHLVHERLQVDAEVGDGRKRAVRLERHRVGVAGAERARLERKRSGVVMRR